MPVLATASGALPHEAGQGGSASSLAKPAVSPKPVSTGPGQSAVAVTPVPRSSPVRLRV